MIRTCHTHPIRGDAAPVRNDLLKLTFCSGKRGDSLNGAAWARDLEANFSVLQSWGADLVVTPMELHEFELLSVPDLGSRVAV